MARTALPDLEEIRRRIAPHVRRARKVLVFGSVARGEADPGSHPDLIIVADTARPFFERFKDFSGLYGQWPRLDLLVYTPEELERMAAEGNPLIQQALE
jgi:predicted nucleotidyltransferase